MTMQGVRGLKAVWALGAAGGLAIVGETVGIGLLVLMMTTITTELMGAVGHEAEWWALYSAPLWAPVAVGDSLRRMESITGMRMSPSAMRGAQHDHPEGFSSSRTR